MLTRVFTCIAVLLVCPHVLRAEIPGASDPKAITEHTFRAALLDFNRRTSVETYKQVGKRDPKWDEPAIAFLESVARYFANTNVAARYQIQPAPTLKELEAQGRAVIALGCDDPLVVYGLAVALDNQGKRGEAQPLLQKVLDEFPASRYPINRLSGAANRMLKFYDRTDEQGKAAHERCEQTLLDALLASISVAEFEGMDRRAVLFLADDWLAARPLEQWKAFCEDGRAVNADPWLLNMLEGLYHVKAGWAARGSGFAFKVQPQGWMGFAEHLKLARACFVRAIELEPTYPEAATAMIPVAMAGHAGKGEDARFWFERAASAQFDYAPAYSKYLWATWPRWGGSHEEMFAFGLECAATKRYDTGVPFVLVLAVEAVIRDLGGNGADAWRRDGIYDATAAVLEAYAARPEEASRKAWNQSYHVAIAAHARRYADAHELMVGLKNQLDWNAVDRTRALPVRLYAEVSAMVGPQGAALQEAELAADRGEYGDAIETYDEAIAAIPEKSWNLRYVRGRAAELRWLQQFESGEWVDLQPDKGLTGWYGAGGAWSVDEQGRLVGKGDASGCNLICAAEFGPRYEITGKLEFVGVDDVKDPSAGPIITYSNRADSYAMWMRQETQRVVMRNPAGKTKSWPAKVGDANEFRVAAWNGHLFGWVNGQEAFDGYEIPRMSDAAATRIGVGSQSNYKPATITLRFSELKIRRLQTPPVERQLEDPEPSREFEGDL